MTNVAHRYGEWHVKQYRGRIAIVRVDGIDEKDGWKGERDNQLNHTTAGEVELSVWSKGGLSQQ